jgi:uncharacterized phiE125 gp8 family phage protein
MSNILREKAFSYSVITPPAEMAVTLDAFKAYAKITNTAEDATLTTILMSAILFGQSYTRRTFITTEFKTFRDEFLARSNYIELRKSPFQSLESFKYYDESNTLVDVDSAIYMTTQESDYSKIALLDGQCWSSDVSTVRPYQSIEITFKAGYGDASDDVPDDIKNAIMAHALNAVRNRGDCGGNCSAENLPPVSKTLYSMYRIRELRVGF